MKILYLSSHAVLEFDEIKLLTELGHQVFSMGIYQSANVANHMRPAVPNLFEDDRLRELSLNSTKDNLHPELINWADLILMMHNTRIKIEDHPQPWLDNNWKMIKDKKVVWRSIGQSTRQIEESLKPFRKQGLKIVRYSPFETNIPEYQGEDAVIRFYKDPDEYKDWNGTNAQIVNISQAMFGSDTVPSRGDHMAIDIFKQVLEGKNWKIFGPNNDNAGEHDGGLLSFEDLKSMLRFNRVFFYTGTRPASYTLGLIEAMMIGIPIVSVGPKFGDNVYRDQKSFEVHEIIGKSGEAGFWSDDINQLREYCDLLINEYEVAKQVSEKGRARAIELFGKQTISKQWEEFFNKL